MIDIEGFRNYLYEEELSENTIKTYIRGVRRKQMTISMLEQTKEKRG